MRDHQHKLLVECLGPTHCLEGFKCGVHQLDQYLRRHARNNEASRYGRTYVLLGNDARELLGFYTLVMSSVAFINVPESFSGASAPRYPVPTVLLASLAVDHRFQGRGYGAYLLMDSMLRALNGASVISARAMEVHAINDNAKDFYIRYGFLPLKDDGKHLFLPMTVIERLAEDAVIPK